MLWDDKTLKRIHCLGVGGVGVSALAEILLKKGYVISGTEKVPNQNTERLLSLGATIESEYPVSQRVLQADLIIYSSAIGANHPELLAAKHAGIKTISRGEALGVLMKAYHSVAVAGAHGKTTTTALLAHTFQTAELDPTVMVGGICNRLKSPAAVGKGPYFISEADESDASLLFMHPACAIVTNVDADHLESYGGKFERLQDTYLKFLHQVSDFCVLSIDDPILRQMIPTIGTRKMTYGFSSDADYRISSYQQENTRCCFNISHRGEEIAVSLNAAGEHNALNATAVFVVARAHGILPTVIQKAFETFAGVQRRFCVHGHVPLPAGAALLLEDYGHHPKELMATLSAVRRAWPKHPVVWVFQPHRYSRTRDCMQDFSQVLGMADKVILLDVYAAGEKPLPGVDSPTLAANIEKETGQPVVYVPNLSDLPQAIKGLAQTGDIVILQGAGDVGTAASALLSLKY